MLRQLQNYAQANGLVSEPGFASRKVHWVIHVDANGEFSRLEDLRQGKEGKVFAICPDVLPSDLARAPHDKPRCHFLVESARLLLEHLEAGDDAANKVELRRKKRSHYRELLALAAREVPDLSWLRAAAQFFDQGEAPKALAHLVAAKGRPTDNVVIAVDNKNPLEEASWHPWWREHRRSYEVSPEPTSGLIRDWMTGDLVVPVLTHSKIKGLVSLGGLSTGDVLMSFDKTAFTSLGFQQGLNAPMGGESSAQHVVALNHLIQQGRKLGSSLICYWQTPPNHQSVFDRLWEPEDGGGDEEGEGTFNLLVLSGAAGRVMVRDWSQGRLANLREAISQWFSDLTIVDPMGERTAPPPGLLAILNCLARDHEPHGPTTLVEPLLRAALDSAVPLPSSLLAYAIPLIRADVLSRKPPSAVRMGLVRAFHNRKFQLALTTHLDPDRRDSAYLCGRLLALFSDLQDVARGEARVGPVQQLYAAASARPRMVIPRLLAAFQRQLRRLPKTIRRHHERALDEVLAHLSEPPPTLDLEGQSLSSLGYYQQQAFSTARRLQAWASRQSRDHDEGDPLDEPY